mmetsp:Transcript_7141/g.12752  ORF Transcript_7141/g.12752 Transcript_7141/m.12752 type:complete len:219 (-) Transcript_7141:4334-4990(-)
MSLSSENLSTTRFRSLIVSASKPILPIPFAAAILERISIPSRAISTSSGLFFNILAIAWAASISISFCTTFLSWAILLRAFKMSRVISGSSMLFLCNSKSFSTPPHAASAAALPGCSTPSIRTASFCRSKSAFLSALLKPSGFSSSAAKSPASIAGSVILSPPDCWRRCCSAFNTSERTSGDAFLNASDPNTARRSFTPVFELTMSSINFRNAAGLFW